MPLVASSLYQEITISNECKADIAFGWPRRVRARIYPFFGVTFSFEFADLFLLI